MGCKKCNRVGGVIKKSIGPLILCLACIAIIIAMVNYPMFQMSHEDVPVMMLEDAGTDGMLGSVSIENRDTSLLDSINMTTTVMFYIIAAVAVAIAVCGILDLRIPSFVLAVCLIAVLYVLHYLVTTDYTEMLKVFKIRNVSTMIGAGKAMTVCLWASYISAYTTLIALLRRKKAA